MYAMQRANQIRSHYFALCKKVLVYKMEKNLMELERVRVILTSFFASQQFPAS